MEITYSIYNRCGLKTDQRTGKACRNLTLEQTIEFLSQSIFWGTDLSRFTVRDSNQIDTQADWFLEDNTEVAA